MPGALRRAFLFCDREVPDTAIFVANMFAPQHFQR
jgi:hypothetical protein